MPGSSALYWSDNFMVVTRLRAAVMASGDGACADTAQIENTSMLTMSNRRLDMVSSGDRSRDAKGNRLQPCASLFMALFGAWPGLVSSASRFNQDSAFGRRTGFGTDLPR